MLLSDRDGTPAVCAHGLNAPPPQLPDVEGASACSMWSTPRPQFMRFHISFCTANVNSLCAGGDGYEGRLQYLRSQIKTLGLNFVGIQEARTAEFCSCVDHVLRLAGGCHQRRYGVELWVNLSQPYAFDQKGKAVCFQRSDFQVVFKDPRTLLVRVAGALWQGWLLVGYAPQSGLPLQQREAYWHHLHEVVQHRAAGDPLIVMIDANASPGDFDGQAVLQHGLPSSVSTPLFRSFLQDNGLGLPCTGPAHEGPLSSWVTPDGSCEHCIDYIAIPWDMMAQCILSKRAEDFDLGSGLGDHRPPMCIELSWSASCSLPPRPSGPRAKFDAAKITPAVMSTIMDSYVPAQWHQDIESHVQHFNQHVLDGLNHFCPKDKVRPKKAFITDEVWCLRDRKLKLKRRLHALHRRHQAELRVSIFSSWKAVIPSMRRSITTSHMPCPSEVWSYLSGLLCHRVHLTAELCQVARSSKSSLQNAKKLQIQATFEHMDSNASSSQILHALKPILGPTNLKKLKINTLPYLQNHDGDICKLPAEALEIYLDILLQ
eukprot:s2688_g7.t1